jgi:hypothetical protein
MYLYGMEIDWEDGLNNRALHLKNPNASKTCGCGDIAFGGIKPPVPLKGNLGLKKNFKKLLN